MTQEGVRFVTNTEIGKDLHPKDLLNNFDATILCVGATKPNDFLAKTEGREAIGIHFAMEFLSANTKHLLDQEFDGSLPLLNAKGKDVVVIGGGDTGTDCVGTSIRHGANKVVQLEILPKPPQYRADDNPWPEWPKIYRLDYGQEEAKEKWGDDPRQYLVQTKRFILDDNKQLTGIEVVGIKWDRDESGRMQMSEQTGSEQVIPCQLALFAMGFSGPEQYLAEQLELDTDKRSNFQAEFEQYSTCIPSVFAAGDCRRGQSLVVWAINEGRGAARECDRFLMGDTCLP
jgi:glutamate synthase (NADPH/NADH) small chain